MDDEREAALLADIDRLMAAHQVTPSELAGVLNRHRGSEDAAGGFSRGDLRYERDAPDAALRRLSELASLGYAWWRMRAVGYSAVAVASWLTTPHADLDGLAPEQAVTSMPDRVRSTVADHQRP